MTQGAPVLAGMNNDASKVTEISMTGTYGGLSVKAASPHGNQVWSAISVYGSDVGPTVFTPWAEDAVSTR
jgi:hypothetical protein